jgi:pilus assembly protein Flp/PilA
MIFLKHLIDDVSVRRLLREDSGATAIEYGLIAALIAVAAIAALTLVGTSLSASSTRSPPSSDTGAAHPFGVVKMANPHRCRRDSGGRGGSEVGANRREYELPTNSRRFPMQIFEYLKTPRSVSTRLAQDESGATAIEYGLIAALIAVAAIAAFQLIGTSLSTIFNSVATQL